jgi:hypothetical protein
MIKALKEAMDAVERGVRSLKKAIQFLNIPFTSLVNHFNNRTKSKKHGSPSLLIDEEIIIIID